MIPIEDLVDDEWVDFWLTELRTPVLLIEAALEDEERREREGR